MLHEKKGGTLSVFVFELQRDTAILTKNHIKLTNFRFINVSDCVMFYLSRAVFRFLR